MFGYENIEELIKTSEELIKNMNKTDKEIWNKMTKEEQNTPHIIDFRPWNTLSINDQIEIVDSALECGITLLIRNKNEQAIRYIGEALIMLRRIKKC